MIIVSLPSAKYLGLAHSKARNEKVEAENRRMWSTVNQFICSWEVMKLEVWDTKIASISRKEALIRRQCLASSEDSWWYCQTLSIIKARKANRHLLTLCFARQHNLWWCILQLWRSGPTENVLAVEKVKTVDNFRRKVKHFKFSVT